MDTRIQLDRSVLDDLPAEAPPSEEIDWNSYTTTKSYSQTHLNLATIGLQISTLVSALAIHKGSSSPFLTALIVLISTSLALQVLIFALVAILAAAKSNNISKAGFNCTAVAINSLVTTLSAILLIITTAISTVSAYTNLGVTAITGTPQNITV
jgi:hypothetical protein